MTKVISMINRKIKIFTAFLLILFLLYPPLLPGRQKSIDNNTSLPLLLNDTNSSSERYGYNFFVTTDSGENWGNITFGYSIYMFGMSNLDDNYSNIANDGIKDIPPEKANLSVSGGKSSKLEIHKYKPITSISYLIKITRYVNLRISMKNGKKTYDVSKGKLTEGIYSIRFDNPKFEKTLYYYKLENENGITKRSMFL
jgi:hypothetical protein